MEVYILRGVSGSTKTSWHKKNHPTAWVCSADYYFEREAMLQDKTYTEVFNPTLLSKAHGECLKSFIDDLDPANGSSGEVFVIDNTNCSLIEVAPYIAICNAYGITPRVIRFESTLELCLVRNQHNISAKVIKGQLWNLQQSIKYWPKYWPKEEVINVGE